ncbi:hypothetical protein TBC1_111359 [Lentimicrobium saccharophilum]|uniref:Uncharacterized protein n=1 Tax=Lentimicrobium saccharophilum TaxID=1678841 RepID=A0A0S7BRK6_9BACT|nr:hypothetical protein TBC1_111359 [Lentimicrobium saccharophilum]
MVKTFGFLLESCLIIPWPGNQEKAGNGADPRKHHKPACTLENAIRTLEIIKKFLLEKKNFSKWIGISKIY